MASNFPAVLGVIPARGGSKGIPAKNIRPLCGRPLIAYTIEAALNAATLARVVVSTDSLEIAAVARAAGVEVPFMRPADLATDAALSLPVMQHATREMERIAAQRFDVIVMLQPTTPLRTAADIDASVNRLVESGADSVISVVDVGGYHPLRMKRLVGDHLLINYIDQGDEDMRPRQSLPPVFIRNGALYVTRRDVLMHEQSFVGRDSRGYVMPRDRSVNIDSIHDLVVADHLLGIAYGGVG